MKYSPVMMTILCGISCLLGARTFAEPSQARPNVVFILADDLGYGGLGCYGTEWLETPNIDQLAKEGMMFTQGLAAAPTCLPSRAALLSGQYSPRTGCYRVADKHIQRKEIPYLRYSLPDNHGLALEKITIAEAFKSAGYTTAAFGKWHANFYKPYLHPRYQGFDESVELMNHYKVRTDPEVNLPPEVNSADYITDRGIQFMEKAQSEDTPFFLYLPYYLVHRPLETIPEYVEHFKQKLAGRDFIARSGEKEVPLVAAMTKHLDDCVGRVLAHLDAAGLRENTMVVFASDNGCFLEDFNGETRAKKGDHYEGGMRVPYIFRWPGQISAESVCDERIIGVDLYPTFLDMAGIEPPAAYPLDGASLAPLLKGTSPSLPSRQLFCYHPKTDVYIKKQKRFRWTWENLMYDGDFKLIEKPLTDEFEMYNLKDDPLEKVDLSATHPEKLGALRKRMARWKKEIGVPEPTPNPEFNPDGSPE